MCPAYPEYSSILRRLFYLHFVCVGVALATKLNFVPTSASRTAMADNRYIAARFWPEAEGRLWPTFFRSPPCWVQIGAAI